MGERTSSLLSSTRPGSTLAGRAFRIGRSCVPSRETGRRGAGVSPRTRGKSRLCRFPGRLAAIALLQGKPDEALPLFSSAIRVSGYQAANALGLPRPYPAASEDLSEAAQAPLRACLPGLEGAPGSFSRSLALAVVQARLGNTDASQAACNDFTSAVPLRILLMPTHPGRTISVVRISTSPPSFWMHG